MTSTVKPSAANILRIFRAASAEDIAAGREWYSRAHQAAAELAAMGDGDVVRAAAVIAVLSPATPWHRNVQLARHAYTLAAEGATYDKITSGKAGGGLATMGDAARKAAALVLGGDPASIVSGPKVTAFWLRIAEAANSDTSAGSVVVDRHAFDIAVGRMTDDRTRGAYLGRVGGIATVQACYARAASALRRSGEAEDITPSELQAATWVAWRNSDHAHSQARAEARRDRAA